MSTVRPPSVGFSLLEMYFFISPLLRELSTIPKASYLSQREYMLLERMQHTSELLAADSEKERTDIGEYETILS